MTSRTIRSYECESSSSTVQGKFTLWSYPFHTHFYALVSTLKHCMSRFDNMWVLGSRWWGRTYCPLFIKPLGVTTTSCLYCYAMLIDVDWFERIHERCERLLLTKVQLKVATLIHIWVDWGTWESSVACFFLEILGFYVIFLWTATQAQRDHKIIHARNFRVQPQAIMGSGIVD